MVKRSSSPVHATGGRLPGHLDPPATQWPRAPFEVIVETLKAIVAFSAFTLYALQAINSAKPHITGCSTAAASWKYILCPAGRVLCLWLYPIWADFVKLATQAATDTTYAWRLLQTDEWVGVTNSRSPGSSLGEFLSCLPGTLGAMLVLIMITLSETKLPTSELGRTVGGSGVYGLNVVKPPQVMLDAYREYYGIDPSSPRLWLSSACPASTAPGSSMNARRRLPLQTSRILPAQTTRQGPPMSSR